MMVAETHHRPLRAMQQLRQLGEVRRHAAGLVAGEQLGRRARTGLIFLI